MKVALRMAQKNLIIYRTMNGPNFSFHSKITVSQQSYEVYGTFSSHFIISKVIFICKLSWEFVTRVDAWN